MVVEGGLGEKESQKYQAQRIGVGVLAAWCGEGGVERCTVEVRQNRRVQETSLRAQTLWWDLKSRCCDNSLELSPKTLTDPGG